VSREPQYRVTNVLISRSPEGPCEIAYEDTRKDTVGGIRRYSGRSIIRCCRDSALDAARQFNDAAVLGVAVYICQVFFASDGSDNNKVVVATLDPKEFDL
jgi:hypothetical protein